MNFIDFKEDIIEIANRDSHFELENPTFKSFSKYIKKILLPLPLSI